MSIRVSHTTPSGISISHICIGNIDVSQTHVVANILGYNILPPFDTSPAVYCKNIVLSIEKHGWEGLSKEELIPKIYELLKTNKTICKIDFTDSVDVL